ncbi:MAG: hypothetical protein ACPHID_02835 [Thermoplasmatota archaeon]
MQPRESTVPRKMVIHGTLAYAAGHGDPSLYGEWVRVAGAATATAGGLILSARTVGAIAGVVLDIPPVQQWDVRRLPSAVVREAAHSICEGLPPEAVPDDPADRILLEQRMAQVLADLETPDDPCGWYRAGWGQHHLLMERVLGDADLSHALALAVSEADQVAVMRLSGIQTGEVGCNRFWFGFRDANAALAAAWRPAPQP